MSKIELLQQYLDIQAKDESLWFEAIHITEAYLQAELRRICWLIEDANRDQLLEEIRLYKERLAHE